MLGLLFSSQLYGQDSKLVLLDEGDSLHEEKFHEVQISGKMNHHDLDATRSTNQSTEEHLEQIKGLSLVRRGNYAAEPSFRGLNANQTSVTIDGMKIFGACTDRMDPVSSYVAPDNLEKACMDQTGDCNASCNMASLDLRTKSLVLKDRKTNGFLNSAYNSNGNGLTLSGEINFNKNNRALKVQSYYSKFSNYEAGGGDIIPFTPFSKWNASVQYKQKIGSNAVLDVKYIVDRAKDIGYPALPMDVARAHGDILSL
jgi:iron complex outermembrane receptor protein